MNIRLSKTACINAAAIAVCLALAAPLPAAAQQKFVTVGTGGVTGVYYAVGGAICRLVNKDRAKTGIRCSVESTGGSVYNVNAVKSGELDFGMAQSDVQYQAYNGTGPFKEADKDLRAVFSVHPEPFTLVARKEANIKQVQRPQGQARQRRQPRLGHALGDGGAAGRREHEDLRLRARLRSSRPTSTARRCATTRSTPSSTASATRRPTSRTRPRPAAPSWCRSTDPAIDELVKKHPYYAKVTIPGGLYANNPQPTPTYGVTATMVTSSKVPADVVYAITKAVFDNLDEFKKLHPAFAHLDAQHMIHDGLSAPIHEGALRYYQEKGWMK